MVDSCIRVHTHSGLEAALISPYTVTENRVSGEYLSYLEVFRLWLFTCMGYLFVKSRADYYDIFPTFSELRIQAITGLTGA